jgi:hypothetical protein
VVLREEGKTYLEHAVVSSVSVKATNAAVLLLVVRQVSLWVTRWKCWARGFCAAWKSLETMKQVCEECQYAALLGLLM